MIHADIHLFPQQLPANGIPLVELRSAGGSDSLQHRQKLFCCFIAVCGDFRVDNKKIPENHFYQNFFDPGIRTIRYLKSPSRLPPEIWILVREPEDLPGEIIANPEYFSTLNIRLLKLLAGLAGEDHQSSLGPLLKNLMIDSFLLNSRRNPERKIMRRHSLAQIIKIRQWLPSENTLNSPFLTLSAARINRLCLLLYGRSKRKISQGLSMQQSVEQLLHSAKTLSEIAEAAGYGSRELFITGFKQYFGIPPGKLRACFRQSLSEPASQPPGARPHFLFKGRRKT